VTRGYTGAGRARPLQPANEEGEEVRRFPLLGGSSYVEYAKQEARQ